MLRFKVIMQFALRRLQKLSLLSFCLVSQFFCSHSFANETKNILFIVSKDTASYIQIVESIKTNINSTQEGVAFSLLQKDAQNRVQLAMEKSDLIVTLGSGAAEIAMGKKTGKKLIASLITESAFLALAEQYYGSKSEALNAGAGVVVIDQPLQRSIKLAAKVLPDLNHVGLMLGPSSKAKAPIFDKQLRDAGLTPKILSIATKDNPIHKIDPVMKVADVFIPVADSHLINVTTAKWILQLSYKYRVPVIGFSNNYVDAGALAAVYSSPDNVAKQTAEIIIEILEDDYQNNKIHSPKYCTLKFNKNVAWHLGMKIRDESYYTDGLCGL